MESDYGAMEQKEEEEEELCLDDYDNNQQRNVQVCLSIFLILLF